MNDDSSFGRRLRQLREERGLAQEVVAAAVGVRTLSYGRWERNQQLPGLANRLALARYFDVDPSTMIGPSSPVTMDAGTNGAVRPAHELDRLAALDARIDGIEQAVLRCEVMLAHITKLLDDAT